MQTKNRKESWMGPGNKATIKHNVNRRSVNSQQVKHNRRIGIATSPDFVFTPLTNISLVVAHLPHLT